MRARIVGDRKIINKGLVLIMYTMFSRRQAAKLIFGTAVTGGLLSILGCGGGSRTEGGLTADQSRTIALNEANKKKFQEMISEVEPHIKVASDGTLEIPVTRSQGISSESLESAKALLSKTNELIKSGNLKVGEGLNLVAKDANGEFPDPTRMQNVNACYVRWWGIEWYLNDNRTGVLTDLLTGGQLTNATNVLKVYAGGTIGPFYASFIGAVAGILVAWAWTMMWVNWRGGNKGVRVKATWATLMIIEAQPFI